MDTDIDDDREENKQKNWFYLGLFFKGTRCLDMNPKMGSGNAKQRKP